MTFAAGRDALWIYEVNPIDARNCRVTQTACFPRETMDLPDFDARAKAYYHRLDAAIAEDIPALKNSNAASTRPMPCKVRFYFVLSQIPLRSLTGTPGNCWGARLQSNCFRLKPLARCARSTLRCALAA